MGDGGPPQSLSPRKRSVIHFFEQSEECFSIFEIACLRDKKNQKKKNRLKPAICACCRFDSKTTGVLPQYGPHDSRRRRSIFGGESLSGDKCEMNPMVCEYGV